MRGRTFSRRQMIGGLAAVGAFAVVPACGSGGRDQQTGASVEHARGTTVVPASPQRVVTLGYTDQDFALALGVVPVGVRDWFGDQPNATWPWATEALGDARPEVLPSTDIDFERVAALNPDLILAVYENLDERQYSTLSAIAPTVANPPGYEPYNTPWQDNTRLIARALGRDAEDERIVADVEMRFAQVREQHPEFAGRAGVVADTEDAISIGVFSQNDPRGRVLSSLGFVTPPDVAAVVPAGQFYGDIGAERFALLDRDLLVWLIYSDDARAAIEANPVYRGLSVSQQGRALFLGNTTADPLGAAMSFSSPLSLPYLLDRLVPRLAAAIDGDPTTV